MWLDLQEAQEYAESNGMFYIETSAKTSDNVNQLFEVNFIPSVTMASLCVLDSLVSDSALHLLRIEQGSGYLVNNSSSSSS